MGDQNIINGVKRLMDINTDINILGGMPDYNLIRIYIAGEAKDKSTSEVH